MKRTSRDIRTAHRYEVLRQVIAASPASRQGLASATGLSLATVATLVGELLDLRMISEVGFEDSAGGRPRGLVAVNASGGTLIGVDIAETYVHVELFDLALTVLARADEEMRPGESQPERVVGVVAAAIASVVARAGVAPDRVLGVGVSVPGQVDRDTGVAEYAPNLDWHDVPLLDLLAEHTPYPLHLDNPLRACVVAELWFGAARGHEDAVVVNLGTGVGAGLALGGGLHRGVSNSAGEWGHTTLVLNGRLCHCGNHGCVETYVGAPGIMQNLHELSPSSALLHPGNQTATIDALARAAAEHDPVALKTVQDTARYLGAGIADLINLLNPEVVVLSSWVASRLGEPLLDEVRRVVSRHALGRPLAATGIVLSPIATDPVCLGAATFALEGVLRTVGQRQETVRGTAPARSRTAPPS
ncbi:transcriptional regulator [Streptomyces sp. MUSC 125]|uniref:ROK family protein n=1 Tax=Streptomyces sp. MUSC 125 TaxID=1428624 RepID=UPI00057E6B7B|nr:ROK family protein [Streptomyces sp. MUSC 125]KIE28749.1 transcriptional regulator [Streptomyces sp. MUSC 125]